MNEQTIKLPPIHIGSYTEGDLDDPDHQGRVQSALEAQKLTPGIYRLRIEYPFDRPFERRSSTHLGKNAQRYHLLLPRYANAIGSFMRHRNLARGVMH
jgi:hypothetical protein